MSSLFQYTFFKIVMLIVGRIRNDCMGVFLFDLVFFKCRRGLIMGVWNSHTSVGNILGSLIAAYWVSTCWGLSFLMPGVIIAVMGIVCFLFLIERKFFVVMEPWRAHYG